MLRVPSRAEFLLANKPQLKEVPTPELDEGTGVYVRQLNGLQREVFGHACPPDISAGALYRTICVFCVADGEGLPLFSPTDLDALAELTPSLLDRLGKICLEFNAVGQAGVDAQKKD